MELRGYFVVVVAIFPCFCQLFCCATDVLGPESYLRDGECCATDVLGPESYLRDGDIIASHNLEFVLGFFPVKKSSSKGRYVGIWYKFSPDNVVWVANRDDPIIGSSGVFRIQEGNLHVFDTKTGKYHWSTEIENSTSTNLTAKLTDTGNLVLGETLWQSFEHPTDTFLPTMEMITDLKLTSWSGKDDPKPGNFTFSLDDEEKKPRYIIKRKNDIYWRSGGKFVSSDGFHPLIDDMLSASVFKIPEYSRVYSVLDLVIKPDYNRSRLVITFSGSIEFLRWNKTDWEKVWFEPRDHCSLNKACGSFGSCNNASNFFPCKCLPGYKPKYSDRWNSGDFSGGCIQRVLPPSCNGTTFLNLTKMNLANPESRNTLSTNEMDCRKECLNSCKCVAYSFNRTRRGSTQNSDEGSCTSWNEESLNDIQEEISGGENLFVRVALSELELSAKTCHPCGTTAIPYPLSIGPRCGDPAYSSFRCNNTTGKAIFKAVNREYRILSIDQDTRKFFIGVPRRQENCEVKNSSDKSLQLDKRLPFKVTNSCYTGYGIFNSKVSSDSEGVIEIEWEPPHEPTCTNNSDCTAWPNSSCKNAKDRKEMRCLCQTHFKWDGQSLNCTKDDNPTKNTPLALIVAPSVVSVAVLACAFVAFVIWRRKTFHKEGESRKSDQRSKVLHKLDTQNRIKHLMDSGEFVAEDEEAIDVPFFDFESIVAATNDFSDANKLGEGGYGPVYKGTFPGGHEIAVKRLSTVSGQGLQEFKNEVVLIAKLQHRNLVKLRGYCIKGEEKILLYEYMPNKSLDSLFASQSSSVILDWEKRFNIILGIARGLLYLHQDSRLRIIHRDFKTSNILLDEEMEPKISDFGLARIVGGKQTEANTNRIVGTYGYMSPEYALEGLFSVKSDVFSFGVVLLEIITGRRNTRLVQSEPPLSLLGYAWRLWTENKILDLIDPDLTQSCREDQFVRCFKVSLLCVQEDPTERPTMSTVMTWLDSETTTVPSPQQPAFVLRRGSNVPSSSSSGKPEITVTFEDGR